MKISVIITTHNERRDLEVTATLAAYGSTRPHEIIVVDDASDDWPVGDRLDNIERVRVIRNKTQLGCAASRNAGARHATGDVVVFIDSHMRMNDWWLDCIKKNIELHPSAIFCSSCCAFNRKYGCEFFGCGARFDIEKREPLGTTWLPYRAGCDEAELVPVILGACYIFPMNIWKALRGFNPNFYGWGGDEEDISIRAWQRGFEVRGIHNLVLAHRWDRMALKDDDKHPDGRLKVTGTWQESIDEEERLRICPTGHMMNAWQGGFNALVNCYTLFEDDQHFHNLHDRLRDRWPDAKIWHRYIEQECNMKKFRKWVQAHRVRSDEEITRIIGPFVPDPKIVAKSQQS